MNLARLQREFSTWLQADKPADAAPFGERARLGLAIYQNNFRAQLATCLEDSFDKTRQWIGGEAFHEAIVHHVERVPPSSWTLDAYPRDFPATLAMLYPIDPEVAELAALELALADAFVGPDVNRLAAEQIASADWDCVTLLFVPMLDLLPMTTNAAAIWTALAEEASPPMSALLPTAGALLVWRDGETPRFRAIEAMEERAILLMRGGMTFARLCADLVEDVGEAEGVTLAGAWLGQWLADGLVSDLID
ncbi:hypothetical protein FHS91_003671 [Sphingobium xanthum]|jgi:hypothetical protein|uniref:HvfC/BufC N-terminal domain-containing protein n=1 Tax=Sphingobium xanthum TaxID=1387165 RepID=UPI001C8B5BEA|nr:DNA-binding domain-containing protein [Sphingobium xanthum]